MMASSIINLVWLYLNIVSVISIGSIVLGFWREKQIVTYWAWLGLMWCDMTCRIIYSLLEVSFRESSPQDSRGFDGLGLYGLQRCLLEGKFTFRWPIPQLKPEKQFFLRKCTVTDKYQKSVPIFELITATVRLNAQTSFTVPQV